MAAMDFPNSPTVGQSYTVGNSSWVWTGTTWDAVLPGVKISDTAPSGAFAGDIWYNSVEGRSYIYYDSFWVELSPGIKGADGDPAMHPFMLAFS
jgi:hypothetical protein